MYRALPFALALLLVAGCGGSGKSSVSGTVKMKDGTPVKQGTVTLSSGEESFYGQIADGEFKIEGGATNGEYKVTITGTDGGGYEADPSDPGQKIAEKYHNNSSTDLKITVSGSTTSELTLDPG